MKNKIKHIKLILISLLSLISIYAQTQDLNLVAPNFTLSDINGNKISLSDYKGKVVYIDFWATWCKPCMMEIPHSKKLQEEFKGDSNIVFINISFDQDIERWKKIVKVKKMKGVQLISPEGQDSKVMRDYEVKYIPHFLIIDKNGIRTAKQAKSPGMEGIAEELTKIINQ